MILCYVLEEEVEICIWIMNVTASYFLVKWATLWSQLQFMQLISPHICANAWELWEYSSNNEDIYIWQQPFVKIHCHLYQCTILACWQRRIYSLTASWTVYKLDTWEENITKGEGYNTIIYFTAHLKERPEVRKVAECRWLAAVSYQRITANKLQMVLVAVFHPSSLLHK